MNILRFAWILPNVLLYFVFFFLVYFISSNYSGLKELNNLSIYVILTILILGVAIYGSIKILSWIKEGKI
jgi:hypothetical protein